MFILKSLQLAFVLFLICNGAFAQQWNGNNNTTDGISRQGNVGIGSAATSHILQVNGWSEFGDQNANDPFQYGILQLTRPANTGDDKFHLAFVRAGNIVTGLGYVTNSNTFGIWASPGSGTNGTPTISLSPDANVGIGTSNPGSFKLAVEGKIAARGVKVTNSAFADYVFEPTYKLRPLSTVESYINENKHLPGIPSAKEVEKEGGFELATMNVKLLEKIEELTLYIIEQDKRIKVLEGKKNKNKKRAN